MPESARRRRGRSPVGDPNEIRILQASNEERSPIIPSVAARRPNRIQPRSGAENIGNGVSQIRSIPVGQRAAIARRSGRRSHLNLSMG